MRIGLGVGEAFGTGTLEGLVADVQRAADRGFASAWTAQLFGLDALTSLAVAGLQVPGLPLGTAVVPTYPRHPVVMASQALTVQAAIGNRLTLGVGLSHQFVIEALYGYSFARPARHMREYLSVLGPLLRGESVSFQGETLSTAATVSVVGADPPSLVVAALGPAMLKMTAELADGTVTWMTGPETIADHIVPTITSAAAAAGRPDPRIIAGLAFCVTDDVATARAAAAQRFSMYGQLPSYRAMLDREGAAGPEDVVVIGDEATVASTVGRIADAGATELLAMAFGTEAEVSRTLEVLAGLASVGAEASRVSGL